MMSTIAAYVAPLLVFGLVVFVHELGHFVAAKMAGVYAPVFSLGWGRRLFGWRRGETDYRVSLFPLGGYVRMATREDDSMAGIEGGSDRGTFDGAAQPPEGVPPELWDAESMAPFGPKAVPQDRWVESKSTAARVFILSAGVLMNILLTLVVSTGIFYTYGSAYRPAVVDSVVVGAPAEMAGLRAGDHIVAVNGESVKSWDQVVDRVSPVTEGELTFKVERGTQVLSLAIRPDAKEEFDSLTGVTSKVGRVGMLVRDSLGRDAIGPGEAITLGATATWGMTTNIVSVLKGLVTGQVSAKNLGGPIQIARTSVQAARRGAETLWSLIAFLSLNIAILNLVPIPVLDGGQILLVVAESVKGSAFSSGVREGFARVGILAVLALLVLVMFNDVRAMFAG